MTIFAAVMAAGLMASPASAYMVYVSNEKDNTVTVVDFDTMEVVKTIKVGQRPRGITISHDGKFVYLCASDDDTIEIIDTATCEIVGSLALRARPRAVRALARRQNALCRQRGRQSRHSRSIIESKAGRRRDSGRRGAGGHGHQPRRQDHGQHVGDDEHGALHRHLDA